MPKKRLLELRDIRVQRLSEEQKALEKQQRDAQNEMTRQQILQK